MQQGAFVIPSTIYLSVQTSANSETVKTAANKLEKYIETIEKE
jgi:hypothetical protein